jgi:uncharacterized SAM-binding protein YcdF (DUF218 family)
MHNPGLIVVLGSPNSDDGILSEMGRGRLNQGLRLFAELKQQGWKFLLTGGFGEHFNQTEHPHAFYAKQYLLACGVEESQIVDFALSRNTVDDALQARAIVDKLGVASLLIVSSDFHMPRVEFIFNRVFPDKTLRFIGAPYLQSCVPEDQVRLAAHEDRELTSLRESGRSIVGGALSIDSWRKAQQIMP